MSIARTLAGTAGFLFYMGGIAAFISIWGM